MNATSFATISSIILTGLPSWNSWYAMIRQVAVFEGIWEFINPDSSEQATPFPQPVTIAAVSQDVASFSALSDAQEKDLWYLQRMRKYELDVYNKQQDSLKDIFRLILTTIAQKYYYIVSKETTARGILTALRSRLAPTGRF